MISRVWMNCLMSLVVLLAAAAAQGAVQALPTQQLIVISQPQTETSPGAMELRRVLVSNYGFREREVRLTEVSPSALISELFRVSNDLGPEDELIIYWKLPVRRDPAYSRAADDLGVFIGNELPSLLRKLSSRPKFVLLDSCDLEGWNTHRQQSKYAFSAAQQANTRGELILGVCSDRNPKPPLLFLTQRLADRTQPFNVIDLVEPLFEMDPPAVVVGELPSYHSALELRRVGEDSLRRLANVIRSEGSATAKTNAMDELVVAAVAPEQIRQATALLSEVVANEQQTMSVRQYALGRLGKLGFSETPEVLKGYLLTESENANAIVRADAATLLASVQSRDALQILEILALKHKGPPAAAATQALSDFPGPEPARILAAILNAERGEEIHVMALDAVPFLELRTPELRDAVQRRLKDRDDNVRASAVAALASYADAPAVDAIIATAGDADTTVRYQVALTLSRFERTKPGQATVAIALEKLSRDDNARVREASLMGIAKFPNRRGATRVIEALEDRDEDVRLAAISAVVENKFTDAIPRLRTMLRDPDAVVRGNAANALRLFNDRNSLSAIEAMEREEKDESARFIARTAINSLRGSCANIEGPEFKSAARATDRARAIGTICSNDLSRAFPMLKEFLSDANFEVRTAAADALGRLSSSELRRAAEDIFATGSSLERIGIARALGQHPEANGTELLSRIDRQEPDVRLAMIAAMGQRTDDRARSLLKEWTRHQDDAVQLTVAKSLRDQSEKLFAKQAFAQALDAALTGLETRRKRRDSAQDSEIATDLNNVGVIYLAMKDLDQASNYLNQARARREALSARDPDLAVIWLNLAAVGNERKDWKSAEAAYLRALSIRESTLSPRDPLVNDTYAQVIDFYEQRNRAEDAKRYRDLQRKRAMSVSLK
jgi:HEAT repeat protein